MRLTMDLSACQTENAALRGIGRYSLALVKHMIAQKPVDDTICLLLDAAYSEHDMRLRRELHVHDFDYYHRLTPGNVINDSKDWRRIAAGEVILDKYNCLSTDVLYISSIFEGFSGKSAVPQSFHLRDKFLVSTVYDLIPLIFQDVYLKDDNYKNWYDECLKKVKECNLLLSISESTRQDVIRLLDVSPKKVVNISGAVNTKLFHRLKNPESCRETIRSKYRITKPFIMYTGGLDWRKNIEGLVRAYANLPAEIKEYHQLVIVCSVSMEAKRNIMNAAHSAGLSNDDVIFTGFVPDDDLVTLYNLCELFVFPSFYEGLGLPVLEAMSCGAPVIGANNSSIAEIIDRKDALFSADDTEDMASCMARVLCGENLREELSQYSEKRAKDFSWEKTAQIAYDAIATGYEEWSRKKSRTSMETAQRRHIAMVTPLPPQKTGIADYTAELLHVLYEIMDVDLYTDCGKCNDDIINNHYNIKRFDELPIMADTYDAIIYQIGNSNFHTYMYDLLMRYPGIVVSHDFFLDGLLSCVACDKKFGNVYFDDMFYGHGVKGVYFIRDVGSGLSPFPMNKRILDMSTGVIFHSIYARKLYEKFYHSADNLNYTIINLLRTLPSLLSISEREKLRYSLGIENDVFVVTSFGIMLRAKMSLSVLKGYIKFTSKMPHVKTLMIFVGQNMDEAYEKEIQEIVAERNDVKLTGYASREEYTNYLSVADVAVQLRQQSRGETSGAALDVLAHGVPLIVNDYASFEEFPDDVVVKVPERPSADDIAGALCRLATEGDFRSKVGQSGYDYIKKDHDPRVVAKEYLDFVNRTIARESGRSRKDFIKTIGSRLDGFSLDMESIKEISSAYRENHFKSHVRHIIGYMDSSMWQWMISPWYRRIMESADLDCARCYKCDDGWRLADERGNDVVRTEPNDIVIVSLKYLTEDVIDYVRSCHDEIYIYADGGTLHNEKECLIKEVDGVIADKTTNNSDENIKWLHMDVLLDDIIMK